MLVIFRILAFAVLRQTPYDTQQSTVRSLTHWFKDVQPSFRH